MNINEIIEELKEYTGELPKEALQQALLQKEKIIPKLLEMLEYTKENISEIYNEEDDFFGYIYAIFLLAEFRETKLFPYLIDLLNKDEVIVEYILGEDYTEYLPRLLASSYNGDDEALFSIIENDNIDEFVRACALQTFAILYLYEVKDRKFIVNYFTKLINEKVESDKSYLYAEIFYETQYLRLIELEGIIDKTFVSLIFDDEIQDLKDTFKNENYKINRNIYPFKPFYEYIHDIINIMENWQCFCYLEDEEFELSYNYDECQYVINKRRSKQFSKNIKLGRNELCYCGSGKKYKKCCIDKVDNVDKQNLQELEDLDFIDNCVAKAKWYLEREQYFKSCCSFRYAWIRIQCICEDNNIKSISEYDKKYEGYDFLFNWIQEYSEALEYSDEENVIRDRINLCDRIEDVFDLDIPSEIFLKQHFIKVRAYCEFLLGNIKKAEKIIENYLKENPNWIWGYIEMSDWYHNKKNTKNYNLQKAKDILLKAEKLGQVEDIEFVYERLEYIYNKLGEKELAKQYDEKFKKAVY